MAHHGLEAVLRVQVPPLDEAVLRAVEQQSTQTKISNTAATDEEAVCNVIIVPVLPRDQEVLFFEEQGLCDDIFVASQSVQPTLIDDVPHDHICVLIREKTSLSSTGCVICLVSGENA